MARNSQRPAPVIPDHEVLRKIGGGSYGEVWLARGVTGALRAVKVVWREDFDDERTFEREFEGILKFEPISRDHPAMVNILHVGRGGQNESAFYYYVMELGDDVVNGREINPVEYEARTLRSDVLRSPTRSLPTDLCIDVGLRLAEALQHLHEAGLAHRDVKPSNVIFVNGKAKLADIGLVATRDQRTFVGTEGFVPPEGPGSAQADLYSLGKVLYEIATGKDRLDFPELPDEIPGGAERKAWLSLNQVICEVCDPQLSKRKTATASQLAESLHAIQMGRRHRRRRSLKPLLGSVLFLVFISLGLWQVVENSPWLKARLFTFTAKPKPEKIVAPKTALVKITSTPEGADVIDLTKGPKGESKGTTPTSLLKVHVGDNLHYRIVRDGYAPFEIETVVPAEAAEDPWLLDSKLHYFSPPNPGKVWTDCQDQTYDFLSDGHLSHDWVSDKRWQEFANSQKANPVPPESVDTADLTPKRRVVLTTLEQARRYCGWLAWRCVKDGFLTDRYEVVPILTMEPRELKMSEKANAQGLRPFKVRVRKIPNAELVISTEPLGAEVFLKDADSIESVAKGVTNRPLKIADLRPGEVLLQVSRDGYKPYIRSLVLQPGEQREMSIKLVLNNSVVMDRPWENSLGMHFVPIQRDLMASIWETRVRDFEAFCRDKGISMPPRPDFRQNPDHPIVNVSRTDAEAFCAWLTETERQQERLSLSYVYRLPTDYEWSLLAGLNDAENSNPARREAQKTDFFWGTAWPPNAEGVTPANLADSSLLSLPGYDVTKVIPKFDDGYAATAPVGSFPANKLGLYDVCGNAQEWVADDYSNTSKSGVLRGGGWSTYRPENLLIGARNTQPPTYRDVYYGFRVVLAKERPPTDKPPENSKSPKNG
jgi:eukaryotic-like serine/threonine-protein kinase